MSKLLQPDAMIAPLSWPVGSPPVELALPTKYELDAFQKHAVLGIHAGDDVFVTAKTGSGKTFVGEYLCARAVAAGKRVFYTTPIKSLSNQKYHDLKQLFGDTATVGILTGDIKVRPDAQIVVMTAEILRNLFYKQGSVTEGVGLSAAVTLQDVVGIVMDEAHYIQDPDRGHVWEESLVLCPRTLQLVLLSATMPSAAALGDWLSRLRDRPVHLLSTTYRIVPLVHGLLEPAVAGATAEGWRVRPTLDAAGRWIGDAYSGWLAGKKAIADAASAHKKAVATKGSSSGSGSGSGSYWNRGDHDRAREATGDALRASKIRVEGPLARLQRTIDWLESAKQLPALFFLFSRRECERLAGLVAGSLLDLSDAAAAEHIIDFHLSRYRGILETSPQYHRIRDLLMRGIAFHHSGLQPLLKEIVEILFVRGLVRVLFATETFSVGLNMPTKTVVFLELEKFSDGGVRRPLRADEYIQMAGRAGRRGLDTQGLVLYEPLREPVDAGTLRLMLTGALRPLESRMRFGYDFVLRLRLLGVQQELVNNSYWASCVRAGRAAHAREIAALDLKVAEAEILLPPAQQTLFAEKAALELEIATSVNSKRKKAETALRRWHTENIDGIPKGAELRYAALQEVRAARAALGDAVSEDEPLIMVDAQENCLRAWGFLEASDGSSNSIPSILGQAATETNEGHHILMPLLAFSGLMEAVPIEEIPCVLATFLREGSSAAAAEDAEPGLAPATETALRWVSDRAERCKADETVYSPPSFWELSPTWVAIVKRWTDGESIAAIAASTDIMEGNIQRGLLKVANLLEEWRAIATLRRDLATLEKLATLRFLRDEIIVDSIYLHL